MAKRAVLILKEDEDRQDNIIDRSSSSFWRKEPPLLVDNKIKVGGMLSHQQEWWDLPNFVKALVAGYGSGKTFIAAKRAISLALHNAPAPHLQVSPSYKIARRTIVPAISALLNGKQSLLYNLKYKYHKTNHEFEILYKGRRAVIWIASGDDPDSLKGPNVGSAGIDEPFIQDEEVLDQTLARIRHTSAKLRELNLTGTPEQLNWGFDICEGDRKGDYDIGIVHANTKDNVINPDSYYQTLVRAFSDLAARAYLGGEFINLTAGAVYYSFSSSKNVVNLEDPGIELGMGMDFNVNPMASIIFWKNGNHIHVMDEIELPNADTEYMCDHVRDRFIYPKGHEKEGKCRIANVYPDASGRSRTTKSPGGKSDFYYIEKGGFNIDAPYANPNVRDRENAVNGKFCPKEGNPTLTISPKCRNLISYLNKYTHENRNTSKGKAMSHLLDATGYPIHRLCPIVRPIVKVQRVAL